MEYQKITIFILLITTNHHPLRLTWMILKNRIQLFQLKWMTLWLNLTRVMSNQIQRAIFKNLLKNPLITGHCGPLFDMTINIYLQKAEPEM